MDQCNISSSASSIVKITHILEKKRPSSSSSFSIKSVRKPASKPWKKEIAPPKVYRVHSKNFRKVVQRLTGAVTQESEHCNCSNNNNNNKRLQSMAPPPLETKPLAPLPSSNINVNVCNNDEEEMFGCSSSFWNEIYNDLSLMNNDIDIAPPATEEPVLAMKLLGSGGGGSIVPTPSSELCSSPSPYAWHSFPFLSPGTMASLEEGTVP